MHELANSKSSPMSRNEYGQVLDCERGGMRRLISPFRCRVWTQHSRPEEQLTESACRALQDSIATNGQHQPALGRPVNDDPECDVEIICGARRCCAARTLGRDLLVEVRHLTDAEAYVAMYEENLLREGDSPYVRGQILVRALRSGTYTSQEHLGRAFNLSHSSVSRLLTLAQLPSVLVGAFRSPADIKEGWGIALHRLWSDIAKRSALATKARALSARREKCTPRDVYEMLICASTGSRHSRVSYRNIPIRGASGAVLFHEQDQLGRVIYIVPKPNLTPESRQAIKRSLLFVLDRETRDRCPESGSSGLPEQPHR